MTLQQFKALAQQGYNRVALVRTLPADLDTPLSVYLKLANAPYSYLLESVVGGERFGRYSIIGLPARTILRVNENHIRIETDGNITEQHEQDNPLDFIANWLDTFHTPPITGLPRFHGGLAGYFGYDTVRYIEKRLAHTHKPDTLHTPDILLLLSEELAVIDNLTSQLILIVYANPQQDGAYDAALQRLDDCQRTLQQPVTPPATTDQHANTTSITRETPKADYLQAVARAKAYIAAGDMMQVQIGQRLVKPFRTSPLSLYRALRAINPSPYLYYYDMKDFHVVGASPEILVRQEQREDGKYVTIRPLAGTRPRGDTPQQDADLAKELLSDPKEIAEHLMLIDLARNDIGRIAETGTVKVTDQMTIERYSHVMHIVSAVEGKLKSGIDNMDVLRATFPAGTLTGAPKIRAMEIIDELEPGKRGIYGGAVGYLGFNGEMDLAIAIRTAIIKDGKLYAQAAAGIVADSIPDNEWQETENKARAVLRAAELAEQGQLFGTTTRFTGEKK